MECWPAIRSSQSEVWSTAGEGLINDQILISSELISDIPNPQFDGFALIPLLQHSSTPTSHGMPVKRGQCYQVLADTPLTGSGRAMCGRVQHVVFVFPRDAR